jgi:hypothetical protein
MGASMWWIIGGLLFLWTIVSFGWLLATLFTPAPEYKVIHHLIYAPVTVILLVIVGPIWIVYNVIRFVKRPSRQRIDE